MYLTNLWSEMPGFLALYKLLRAIISGCYALYHSTILLGVPACMLTWPTFLQCFGTSITLLKGVLLQQHL